MRLTREPEPPLLYSEESVGGKTRVAVRPVNEVRVGDVGYIQEGAFHLLFHGPAPPPGRGLQALRHEAVADSEVSTGIREARESVSAGIKVITANGASNGSVANR